MTSLHFRSLGQGPPLVILHGLLGTSDNWQTLGKSFSEHFTVYLVDQRNHGRSFHTDDFSYQHLTDDLLKFVEEQKLAEPIILGHSMGGKVAMNFALQHPEKLSKLIVADIAPKSYPVHHERIMEGLMTADLPAAKSRNDVEAHLANYIDEEDVRLFLMKNLYRKEDGQFGWRLNLPVINRNLEQISETIHSESPFTRPTLFIRGGKSRYILPEDYIAIEHIFPNVAIHTIEEAGHWVHAEAPEEFYKLVMDFVKESETWEQ